jgi:hypothetical protein
MWHHDLEQDDGPADHEHGQRMPDPPERPDHGRAAQRPLPADDGGDRHHMVGVGRVADTEQEA